MTKKRQKKDRQITERTCIACRGLFAKDTLIRIVRDNTGAISVDASGNMSGRGCYVCRTGQCVDRLVKQRGLNRTYKAQVGNDIYDTIAGQLAGVLDNI